MSAGERPRALPRAHRWPRGLPAAPTASAVPASGQPPRAAPSGSPLGQPPRAAPSGSPRPALCRPAGSPLGQRAHLAQRLASRAGSSAERGASLVPLPPSLVPCVQVGWTTRLEEPGQKQSLTVTPGLVEFAFSEFYQTPSPLLTSRYCAFVRVHF